MVKGEMIGMMKWKGEDSELGNTLLVYLRIIVEVY
jgi:hypothetical protein